MYPFSIILENGSKTQTRLLRYIDIGQDLQPVILLQCGLEFAGIDTQCDLFGSAVPALADHNRMQDAQHVQLGNEVRYSAVR